MRIRMLPGWIVLGVAAAGAAAQAADGLAAPGAKATLSVDYLYESAGQKRSEGLYDPYTWRVKRSANLVAELAAQPATAMPTLQAIDAVQMAELQGKAGKAQAVGFLVGQVNDPLHARGNEDLPRTAAEDVGLRAGAQGGVESLGQRFAANA